MVDFIFKNILRFVLLMFAVSFVVFALVSLSPIDPIQANLGQAAYVNMSEAKRAVFAEHWGADTPMLERYASWMAGLLHGDMGASLRFNAPVSQVIAYRAGNSLMLMTVAWVVSGVLGFVLGIAAGAFRGSAIDKFVRVYCYVLAATPSFWIGLILLTVFAVGSVGSRGCFGRGFLRRHVVALGASCHHPFAGGCCEHRASHA